MTETTTAFAPASGTLLRFRAPGALASRGAKSPVPKRARAARRPSSLPACCASPRGRLQSPASPTTPSDASTEPPAGPLPAGSRFALFASGATLLSGAALPGILSLVRHEPLSAYASHYEMLLLLTGFGLLHSGLAALRPWGASLVGERLYRVLFALLSLPSACLTIAFFIAHRYDGAVLWSLQGTAGVRSLVGALTAVSFGLLYPATFDLAQVAAVKRPRLTIFEEGVIRITRHPQMWGQVLWCVAHAAWVGSSFAVVASAGLVGHHLFGVWHGDRRLRGRFGREWEEFAERTSIAPFKAVVDGRQKLEWREFARPAYAGVALFVWGTYAAHPAILRLVGELHL